MTYHAGDSRSAITEGRRDEKGIHMIAGSSPSQPTSQGTIPAGWYRDPEGLGQRWWDGAAWGPRAPQPNAAAAVPPIMQFPVQEKSGGIAVLLTVLWPGVGHLYLGLTQKAIPYVVANAIGLVLGLIFFPICVVIWLVTLCMTIAGITQDTNLVNDALRRGQRIWG